MHGTVRSRLGQVRATTSQVRISPWPKKGNLQPGGDADLVLIDMDYAHVLSNKTVLSKAGWTPYDGMKVRGRSVATYVRGNLVARDGKITARPGTGHYLSGPGAGRTSQTGT